MIFLCFLPAVFTCGGHLYPRFSMLRWRREMIFDLIFPIFFDLPRLDESPESETLPTIHGRSRFKSGGITFSVVFHHITFQLSIGGQCVFLPFCLAAVVAFLSSAQTCGQITSRTRSARLNEQNARAVGNQLDPLPLSTRIHRSFVIAIRIGCEV